MRPLRLRLSDRTGLVCLKVDSEFKNRCRTGGQVNGMVRDIDFQPVLAGSLFGPLRDPEIFKQVRLDPEVHTLVWPNGADFDPATLHDWPEALPAMAERARA